MFIARSKASNTLIRIRLSESAPVLKCSPFVSSPKKGISDSVSEGLQESPGNACRGLARVASMKKTPGTKINGDMLLQRKGHRGRLVHKRLEGEVAAVRAPEGKNSGAGAKPLCTMSSEFWMIPVDLHKIFLGLLAGFSERTPYPSGKRSDGGAVRKVCRGCCCW